MAHALPPRRAPRHCRVLHVFAVILAFSIAVQAQHGTVAAESKISSTSGHFGGSLVFNDQCGLGVTALGDLDGDSVFDLAVGAAGELSLSFHWPASTPAGLEIWAQAWLVDSGAPQGFAATPGVMGVTL